MTDRPNILLILADDMGFSDLGCYGSEIRTPTLDALAADGVRMSQFYNTARCSPARASLLTGLHPHQTGIGILTDDNGPVGYPGTINDRCVTIAEVLGEHGYRTAMRGKWHLSGEVREPNGAWPTRRGFDSFYGIIAGGASYYDPVLTRDETPQTVDGDYYFTTELGREAAAFVREQASDDGPFFLYLPFTAPHWPLHAPESVVATYRGVFDEGWDALRQRRYDRLVESGLVNGRWALSDRDAEVTAWQDTGDKDWQVRRMEVYAAQVELMDAAVGQVVEALRESGDLDNTLIIFLSDNGGCAEEMPPGWMDELPGSAPHRKAVTRDGRRVRRGNAPDISPGGPDTYCSYGRPWANLSNTPFREYKHWVHEGGIATPFIVHWPAGDLRVGIDHDPHQLPDVMATVLDIVDVDYPDSFPGRDPLPLEGVSMLGSWRGRPVADHPLYFEHEGNCAIREGRWKLVRKHRQDWELYDLDNDRTELHDLSGQHPDRTVSMAERWQQWADRCGVKPRDPIVASFPPPNPNGLVVRSYRSSWPA